MRKPYLDNLRWAVGVLVVLYHVIYIYNAQGIAGSYRPILESQPWDVFLYALHPWFMPVLFVVSGICSKIYLDTHTEKDFIKSRTRKLLVPSTLGLFAFQFIQGMVNMRLNGVYETLGDMPPAVVALITAVSGIGVLWFIQLLWVFSLLLLPIRRLEKGRLWKLCERANAPALLLLLLPVWLLGQIGNTPVIVVYRFGYYGAFFLLGYFVFSHDSAIELLKKGFLPLLIAALALGTTFCARYFGQNYADVPVNRTLLYAAFGYAASLAALGGAAKYFNMETPFTRWMARRSYGLYVFHYLGISATALLLGQPALWGYAVCAVAGFGVGYLLNAVISRIPVYRWLVLGIRKEKARSQE